jgi:hypothetical protein
MIRTACMGGWCPIREICALYHAARTGITSERVCDKRSTNRWIPIVINGTPARC